MAKRTSNYTTCEETFLLALPKDRFFPLISSKLPDKHFKPYFSSQVIHKCGHCKHCAVSEKSLRSSGAKIGSLGNAWPFAQISHLGSIVSCRSIFILWTVTWLMTIFISISNWKRCSSSTYALKYLCTSYVTLTWRDNAIFITCTHTQSYLVKQCIFGYFRWVANTKSLVKEFSKIFIFEYFGYLKICFHVFFDADSESPRMT